MRLLLAFALCFPVFAQDAREIVLKSLERDRVNNRIAREYTFVERSENREHDENGAVRKRESSTYDITLLDGSPYRRLIARNDKPLSAKEEEKEREKLHKSIAERKRETEAQRARRIGEWEAKRTKQLNELRQIPEAYDLRLAGEEMVDGHAAWVIETVPKPGYKPLGGMTKWFPKIKGRLWIIKDTNEWVHADAEAIDTISIGGFLARVHKGTRFSFDQTWINNEVWLPRQFKATYSVRALLVKRMRGEVEVTYRDFRKFQTDSRIVDIAEPAVSPQP